MVKDSYDPQHDMIMISNDILVEEGSHLRRLY